MRTLFTTKQREGESLQDYMKRIFVAQDVLKSLYWENYNPNQVCRSHGWV